MKYFTTSWCLNYFLAAYLFFIPDLMQGQVILLPDSVIAPHQIIKVTFDSFPGNAQDWIALAVKGSGTYIQFLYLNGQKKGTLDFNGQVYGEYELRGYYNNENTIRKKVNFRIGNKDLVTMIKPLQAVVKPNDSIRMTFSGFPGNDLDYISIATPGSSPGSYLEYKFLNKRQSGTLALSGRAFGVYELRGYFNNENVIRFQTQVVVGDQTLVITPDKPVFNSNEIIKLTYSGFPGNPQDWISIAKIGTPPTSYVQYKFLNSVKSGGLTFDPVPDGEYELRGYVNNEYVIRVTTPVKVGSTVAAIQTPGILNIQGVLTNAAGQLVPNGSYSILFKLYSASQGGSALWEENQANVSVQSGVFSVVLGKINPFNIAFDKPYFLGIQFGVEAEMTPRVELTSTPYSLMAKNVENNSISTDKIQPNAVTLDKIAAPIVSSINGVTNDGGNINILAGANVAIVNDDLTKSITISAVNPGGGTGGITRINPGNAISVTGQDGPTTTISVSPNSITTTEIQNNAVTIDKIAPNVISSLSGVSNDGGNINLIAGNNISIIPNDANKTITISAAGGGGGTGNISQLTEGSNISIQNVFGPVPVIGLKPEIKLGPGGSLEILNPNSTSVLALDYNNNFGGFFSISNQDATEVVRITTLENRQPHLRMSNRLGNQVAALLANDFSDGELNLSSVLRNPTVQLTANENAGGLINVFNQSGRIGAQLTTTDLGHGRLRINSNENNLLVELRKGQNNGGGYMGVFNEVGTEAVEISTNTGRGGFVGLFNDESTEVVRLITSPNRGGAMSVKNRSGNTAVNISTSTAGNGISDGNGKLVLNSVDNNRVLELETNTAGGGVLHLYNVEGTEALRLTTFETFGGSVRVSNRAGLVAARLNATTTGDGNLSIFSKNDQEAAYLSVNNNGGGFLGIRNGENTEVAKLSTLSNSQPRLLLSNRLGGPVADLRANDFSDGELQLYAVLNNPTLRLTANEGGGGLINVFNQSGIIAAQLSEADGSGFLFIKNKSDIFTAGLASTPFGGSLYITDGVNDLNFRAVLDGKAEGGTLGLFNGSNIPVHTLSTNRTTQEGLYKISSKSDFDISRLEMGGDNKATGYLKIFNANGLKAAELINDSISLGGKLSVFNKDANVAANLLAGFSGSGLLQLYNNKNNLSAGYLADDNGGKLFIGDGGPFTSPRVDLSSTPTGSRLLLYSNATQLMHSLTIKSTGEGLYEIRSKKNYPKNLVEMGGDDISAGYLKISSSLGMNTSFLGNDLFNDGTLELRNNAGNIGGYFTAFRDGGSLVVTDGNPGINHRAALEAGLNGGRLAIYNKDIKLIDELTVGANGEGLLRIISKQDLTKNRVEIGGDDVAAGYLKLFNSTPFRTVEIGADNNGPGFMSTYSPLGKRQTFISQASGGGAVSIMNNAETSVGTMAYDGNGGMVWVTNKDRMGGSWLTNNALGGSIFTKTNAGKLTTELTTANPGGELNIYSTNGINTSKLGHGANGSGILEIGTPNGDKVVRVTSSDGAGFIGVDNLDKKEVVRITANLGKGGGIGLRNAALFDMINLTQDNNFGAILVNNATGGLMTNITHNTLGGSFIGTKDQNGKDAIWLTTGAQGGGHFTTFNTLGKAALTLNADANNIGNLSIHGSAGNEIARVSGTSNGIGLVSIYNGAGINLAGLTSSNASGGGYVYAQTSSGKDVARMTTTTNGGGVVAINSPVGTAAVSYLTFNNANGGYVGVANNAGNDRARITTNTGGSGIMSVSNSVGNDVVEASVTTQNHGTVATYNASNAVIAGLLATTTGHGYIRASNSAGNERASITTGTGGGEVLVRDNSGNQRVTMRGGGNMEVTDADGSYLSAYSSGSGAHLILVDKFQHPRAEIKSGIILAQGPNGIEHSFMSTTGPSKLPYQICLSGFPG